MFRLARELLTDSSHQPGQVCEKRQRRAVALCHLAQPSGAILEAAIGSQSNQIGGKTGDTASDVPATNAASWPCRRGISSMLCTILSGKFNTRAMPIPRSAYAMPKHSQRRPFSHRRRRP